MKDNVTARDVEPAGEVTNACSNLRGYLYSFGAGLGVVVVVGCCTPIESIL